MDDRYLRSGTRRHMSKFKRDIPASNKQNPLWKLLQLQELFARREMFRSGNLQVCRFLSCCDDDIAPFQNLVIYLNGGQANEPSAAMERRDPSFREPLFPVFGDRLSERPLEAHQFLPINLQLLGPNPFPFHSADPIHGLRSAYKNLLRVASPERARPAERPRIDDCHLPSGRPAPRCHRRCGGPSSNDNKVKFPRHAERLILVQNSKALLCTPYRSQPRSACWYRFSRSQIALLPNQPDTALRLSQLPAFRAAFVESRQSTPDSPYP